MVVVTLCTALLFNASCGGGERGGRSARAEAGSAAGQPAPATTEGTSDMSDSEWKATLSPEQYRILRRKGTERAFTGKFWDHKGDGVYTCAGCGQELFDSKTKYKSGSGWPSFWQPVEEKRVSEEDDRTLGMARTEILCSKCGGHLGHVFDDGPPPTGLRYCINSASLDFKARTEEAPAEKE
jgi:peptide-methionine (R)-S-oxide reductase